MARHKKEIKDSLALEAMAHAQFAKQKCAVFHGRRDFLERLKEIITNPQNRWVATRIKAFTLLILIYVVHFSIGLTTLSLKKMAAISQTPF